MTETIKISDLIPDPNNANKGTERGRHLLETSLQELGAGRSILLDKHGRIIAGNKTAETANEIGMEDVEVVRSDGRRLVAVQREDLDLDDPAGEARKLAYADNRVGQVDLVFDFDIIQADLAEGLDLSDFWFDWELSGTPEAANDPNAEWEGMPEYNQNDVFGAIQTIKVHFASREDADKFAHLIGQAITEKTISIWHPKQERENLQLYRAVDES
jgi:hypothetical protein